MNIPCATLMRQSRENRIDVRVRLNLARLGEFSPEVYPDVAKICARLHQNQLESGADTDMTRVLQDEPSNGLNLCGLAAARSGTSRLQLFNQPVAIGRSRETLPDSFKKGAHRLAKRHGITASATAVREEVAEGTAPDYLNPPPVVVRISPSAPAVMPVRASGHARPRQRSPPKPFNRKGRP
ncbi:hypothetical protein [Burkholderia ubonensis]|uniref:hypothetical protein n=1 Tax=Burkholderia ubonensis TaxID=101571 RepID=UPI001E3D2DC2|nr:hypothetical protein [Burkholderia ubonensis]